MRAILFVLALGTLGPGVAAAQGADPAAEVMITFNTERFDPPNVELRRGVRLTFHNLSARESLTIVAADGSFESWPLGQHGQWSHTFGEKGRHEFLVKEHPEVRGTAEVR